MRHINPIPHAPRQPLPLFFVFPHRLFCFGVELCDSIILNLLFGLEAKFFLHLYLHRKSVGVPARAARHKKSSHCFIATYRVFERARLHMMNARHAVGSRRSFVKHKGLLAFIFLEGFLKNPVFLPKLQNLFLPLRYAQLFLVFLHGFTFLPATQYPTTINHWRASPQRRPQTRREIVFLRRPVPA